MGRRRRGGAGGERRGTEAVEAWGEMAARSLGFGVGRLLGSLPGYAGPRGWPPRGVIALRRAASGPSGSVPASGMQPSSYLMLRVQAAQQPAAFWGPLARETLMWDTPYHTVWDCDFSSGKIGWFLGGQLNVSGEWAVGTQGAPNSHLQGGLTESGRRSNPRRIAAPWATSTPAPEAPTFPPAATPRPAPPCPLQPLPTGTRPGVSWSRQLLALPQGLHQWRALKFNHGAPPPLGAQACAKQRGHPGQVGVECAGRLGVGTSPRLSQGRRQNRKASGCCQHQLPARRLAWEEIVPM